MLTYQAYFTNMSPEILSYVCRMSSVWAAVYFLFLAEGNVIPDDEAMTGFILHQNNTPCHEVDKNKELKPCTLSSLEDYQALRYGDSSCPARQGQTGCKDGSYTMTCMPVSMEPVEYLCACADVKGDLNTGIAWDDTWTDITSSGVSYKRGLCDAEAAWCLDGMFKINLAYLIELYAPLDEQITASSEFDAFFGSRNVRRIYLEANNGCGWVPSVDDIAPWIKFDFKMSRAAVGVLIVKSCWDEAGLDLTSSADDVTWSYVGTVVDAVYDGVLATWWFDKEVSARYWKIEPVRVLATPSIVVEIIGYI